MSGTLPGSPDNDAVAGWASAAQAAGIPESSLRRLVMAGKVPATKGADGVYRFQRGDLAALRPAPAPPVVEAAPALPEPMPAPPTPLSPPVPAARRAELPAASDEGAIAGAAFRLFSAGRSPVDVVAELRQPPGVIRELYQQWAELRGVLLLTKAQAERVYVAAGCEPGDDLDAWLDEVVCLALREAYDSA